MKINEDYKAVLVQAEMMGLLMKIHKSECISKEYSCPTGKDVYLTYEKALKALSLRSSRRRTKRVYKCPVCGRYHLTTKDGEGHRRNKYSRNVSNQTKLRVVNDYVMNEARTLKSKTIVPQSYWQSKYRDMKCAYRNVS